MRGQPVDYVAFFLAMSFWNGSQPGRYEQGLKAVTDKLQQPEIVEPSFQPTARERQFMSVALTFKSKHQKTGNCGFFNMRKAVAVV
jgi:hypothetical protein